MYTPTTETGRRLRDLIVHRNLWPMPVTDVLPMSGLPRTGTRFKKIESDKLNTDDLCPPFKMEKHNDSNEFPCEHSQNVTEQSTEIKPENSDFLQQEADRMLGQRPFRKIKKVLKVKKKLKLLKQISKKRAKLLKKMLALKKKGMKI